MGSGGGWQRKKQLHDRRIQLQPQSRPHHARYWNMYSLLIGSGDVMERMRYKNWHNFCIFFFMQKRREKFKQATSHRGDINNKPKWNVNTGRKSQQRRLINFVHKSPASAQNLSPIKNTLKGHKSAAPHASPSHSYPQLPVVGWIVARAQPFQQPPSLTIDDNQCLHCIIIIGINE